MCFYINAGVGIQKPILIKLLFTPEKHKVTLFIYSFIYNFPIKAEINITDDIANRSTGGQGKHHGVNLDPAQ